MEDDTPNLIISLAEIRTMKKRKEDELAYYTKQLEELQVKMNFIRKEIVLTETIIRMVESENVPDLIMQAEEKLLISPKKNNTD
jgi:hypothetical protein